MTQTPEPTTRQRLAERTEAMRAYDEDSDRPSFPPGDLIEELRAARAQDEEGSRP